MDVFIKLKQTVSKSKKMGNIHIDGGEKIWYNIDYTTIFVSFE